MEKFLRRNSYSSDEPSTPITTKCRNKTKSLESLTDLAHKKDQTAKESPKEKKQEDKKSEEKPKPMEQAKVVVKQSGEKIDKKKSQFNYESIIEITLPSAPSLPSAILDVSRDKTLVEEKLEEPITPIICTSKIPQHNNMSPPSVHESFVSNKQNPMEWDSFIPVSSASPPVAINSFPPTEVHFHLSISFVFKGYESSTQQNFQLCNPMELGDSELSALKTYFQKNGLQLPNENLVVVIKNRQDSRQERDRQFSEIKRNKDKWQNIYEKYKEKYHHQSNIEFQSPEAQSTPKLQEPSVSKMTEKSSQTSLVRNTVKSTQVETQPDLQRSSKQCQVTVDRGSLSSKHSHEFTDIYQNQSEVAESFEFIAGSIKQLQQQRTNESPVPSSSKSEESKPEQLEENSVRNSETQNEDISNFDDSLKVAIALLNSLLESRHMKPELKRNLAGKVIQKIVQIQTSRSIQTSTLSSGIYPLSNSSRTSSDVPAKTVKEPPPKDSSVKDSSATKSSSKRSGKSREDVLKDCFKPMTQSEVNYQHSVEDEPTKASSSKAPKSQLMDYVKREKQSHLKWIEKEIEHLRNLRDLLRRNDTPISMDENCPIYANLSSLLLNEKVKEPEVVDKASELMPPPSAPGTNIWNSHSNMKKGNKNRSKLDTPEGTTGPSHDESLASFIDNKNKKFMEKYEKHQKEYEDSNGYTRPYSGNRKLPEAPRVVKSKSASKKTLVTTTTKDVQTSTSLGSSSVFESSDSISVPVNTNTKTSTTHYRSEALPGKEKKSSSTFKIKQRIAGTQTTDSICRTRPIFEAKSMTNDTKCGTTSTTVTQRIYRMRNDKEQQTHPPSIRYTLTFDKTSRAYVRSYMSLPQQPNSEYAVISKSSKEIYNHSCSATLDNRHSEDKENYDTETIIDDNDEIDLQSCLNQRRPDIFTRFEERKSCIAELKKLR